MASFTRMSPAHLSAPVPVIPLSAALACSVVCRPLECVRCCLTCRSHCCCSWFETTSVWTGVGWLYCNTFRMCCVAEEPDRRLCLVDFPPCQTHFEMVTQVSSSVKGTIGVVPVQRLTSFPPSVEQQTLAGTHEAKLRDFSVLLFVEGSEVGRLRPGGERRGMGRDS